MWKKVILMLVTIILLFSSTALADENRVWEVQSNMPNARAGVTVAQINGKIYSIGGSSGSTSFSDVQVYDPNSKVWTTAASMHTARTLSSAAVVDGKIYVFGGYTGNYYTFNGGSVIDSVEMYDPATDTWTKKANMPSSLASVSAVAYDGKVYVFGGLTSSINSVRTVQVYDPASDTWAARSDMQQALHGSVAVTLNNKIYLVGGRYTYSSRVYSVNLFNEYDPTIDKWTSKPSLSVTRGGLSATVLSGKIYAIGGVSPDAETNSVEAYDPVLDKWSVVPSLNNARSGSGAITYNGKIYVIGGSQSTSSNAPVGSVEVFDDSEATIILTATGKDTAISLDWSVYEGATGYNIKRSTTPGGPYTTIASNVTGNSYLDKNVSSGITYYYIVTATIGSTETITSNEASAKIESANRAILTITLVNGLEKEFDLSMSEVNSFIQWYEAKQAGTGTASYPIDKHDNNKGPFTERNEYFIFDKILTFEVSEYTIN
ncbi:Kelch repeat-containing protein [Paenibacillus oleatilyticus]|uniref:Kelch repeat-containing protein n=1 Tax=Paenibacillus oleatilyticus TaxID=2594886 RepID=A0ABV4UX51_9BACL